MKNLITQIACTMLLMAYLMTFASVQISDIKVLQLIQMIGEMNGEAADADATELSEIAGCLEEEVVSVSKDGRNYIKLPVYDIIRPEKFWGIESEKNRIVLMIEKGNSKSE